MPRASAELGGSLVLTPALVALHGVGHRDPAHNRARVHPVLVLPGLRGGNSWTIMLRAYLRALGHDVRTPHPQTMKAGRGTIVQSLIEQIDGLAAAHRAPISIIAWSIGGCFARQATAARPTAVRRLITLGSPVDGTLWYGRHTPPPTPDVPVTALYSRSDGIIDWRRCVLHSARRSENVEIISSHFGMATNPQALHVIGDRLSR
jgi:pimeloyl-ACP methyl ester carboxylesterase